MRDRLDELWAKQRTLTATWIPVQDLFDGKCTEEERQKYLATYIALGLEEFTEALQCLNSRKFWRSSVKNKPVDWKEFKNEIADVLHIFISVCLISGISAEEMFSLYCEKNAVNLQRIKDNS